MRHGHGVLWILCLHQRLLQAQQPRCRELWDTSSAHPSHPGRPYSGTWPTYSSAHPSDPAHSSSDSRCAYTSASEPPNYGWLDELPAYVQRFLRSPIGPRNEERQPYSCGYLPSSLRRRR
jgi:hypothetical protein